MSDIAHHFLVNIKISHSVSEKFREYEKTTIKITIKESYILFLRQARDLNKIPKVFKVDPPILGSQGEKIIDKLSRLLNISQINSSHRKPKKDQAPYTRRRSDGNFPIISQQMPQIPKVHEREARKRIWQQR